MKNQESGRSLIEIIGVLAIGAIMIASAYAIYQSIENRQTRLIASETLKDVAKKTKTLYEFSGYKDVSITQLVTDGALTNSDAPIGTNWSISGIDNNDNTCTTNDVCSRFKITISGLSKDDCNYFATKKTDDWATDGKTISNNACADGNNTITFTVK